jgi:hypothetical protein
VQPAGGRGFDVIKSLVVNQTSVYVLGTIQGPPATVGTTVLTTGGGTDAFVAKLTDDGGTSRFLWAVQAGGPGNESVASLARAGATVYVAGSGFPTLTFGPLTVPGERTTRMGFVAALSEGPHPLPVELVSFTAERQGMAVRLQWVTAQEQDNHHFEVAVSTDGHRFSPLRRLPGQGTSSQRHVYHYVDEQAARHGASHLYYRLTQVDGDGDRTYSPIQAVALGLVPAVPLQAWPNPAVGTVRVRFQVDRAEPFSVRVYNSHGTLVQVLASETALAQGVRELAWDGRACVDGLYLIRLTTSQQTQTVTVVLQP